MKYKLIKDFGDEKYDFQKVIYSNRGFDSEEDFLEYCASGEEALIDFDLIDNIYEGCDLLMKHINNKSKIAVIVDTDVDGFTSAGTLINFINDNFVANVVYYMHSEKQHGLSKDIVIEDDINLVIIPDAGSNDYEQHKALKERGIDVLVIDHHDSDLGYSKDAIVINNQLSKKYPNKDLTGAGMVYKFIMAMNERFEMLINHKKYLDLVAFGLIADMADVRNNETRYMIKYGLENVKTPVAQSLILAQAFSLKVNTNTTESDREKVIGGAVDQIGVAFYIAPLINAMIRSGTKEEKESLFSSFIKNIAIEEKPSTKRGAADGEMELFSDFAARLSKNVKARADKDVKAAVEKSNAIIEEQHLDKNKVIIVDATDISMPDTQIGLIANKIANERLKPTLVVKKAKGNLIVNGEELKNVEYFRGSMRSIDTLDIESFRELLLSTGLMVYAQGHDSAAGVCFLAENYEKLNSVLNHLLKDLKTDKSFQVDFIFRGNESLGHVKSLANLIENSRKLKLFGRGFAEPYVVIEDMKITNVLPMKRNTVKIEVGTLEIIKFGCSQSETESLLSKVGCSLLTAVGRLEVNEYMGNRKAQFKLVDYFIEDDIAQPKKVWSF